MKKIALITGTNRGIGLEFCSQLTGQGYDVFAVCRTPSPELQALPQVKIIEGVDVTHAEDLTKVTQALGSVKLDLLIHNAGICKKETIEDFQTQSLLQQFQTNAVAPVELTLSLLGHLKPGSQVAMITSRMGSIADNSSGSFYGYRMSKAALNMATVTLSRDLSDRHISFLLLHPGYVKTDMTGQNGEITTQTAVSGMLEVLGSTPPKPSGSFWHTSGEPLPW